MYSVYQGKICRPSHNVGTPRPASSLKRSVSESTFLNSEITHGIADWASSVGNELCPDYIEHGPSKIGIAQTYAILLSQREPDESTNANLYRRVRDLVEWITDAVNLPSRYPAERTVSDE